MCIHQTATLSARGRFCLGTSRPGLNFAVSSSRQKSSCEHRQRLWPHRPLSRFNLQDRRFERSCCSFQTGNAPQVAFHIGDGFSNGGEIECRGPSWGSLNFEHGQRTFVRKLKEVLKHVSSNTSQLLDQHASTKAAEKCTISGHFIAIRNGWR